LHGAEHGEQCQRLSAAEWARRWQKVQADLIKAPQAHLAAHGGEHM
jgi:hypothetical protein